MQIIHGEDITKSRNIYLTAKETARRANHQLIELAGISLTLSDLVTSVESTSLLGDTNAVFIEGIFSRRPSAEKKLILEYLQKNTTKPIWIWEGKDVTAQLTSFSQSLILKFDLPKYVFKFLEDLSLTSYHQALTTIDPEPIMALLAGHLHKLIMVRDGVGDFPSWQLSKLKTQASKYTLNQLSTLSAQLLDIDYRHKTSGLPYDLATAIELWVIKNVH